MQTDEPLRHIEEAFMWKGVGLLLNGDNPVKQPTLKSNQPPLSARKTPTPAMASLASLARKRHVAFGNQPV